MVWKGLEMDAPWTGFLLQNKKTFGSCRMSISYYLRKIIPSATVRACDGPNKTQRKAVVSTQVQAPCSPGWEIDEGDKERKVPV